jgi:hypothetical protein
MSYRPSNTWRLRTPSKFRKKPVVIEAMQWDGTVGESTWVIEWMLSNGGTGRLVEWTDLTWRLHIDTLEGVMRADPGDWIIRGVQGEFYPCKPDIFAATYEPHDVTPRDREATT